MKIGITQETDWDSIYKVLETAFLDEENKVIMNLAQELSNEITTPSIKSLIAEAEELYSEFYVLAGRKGHPVLSGELTLEKIATANHLLISPYGPIRNMVDHALHLHGYKMNIQTIVPSLFAALSIVENSDLLVTLPERVALANSCRFNIVHNPIPIEGGSFKIHAVRHARDAESPLHH